MINLLPKDIKENIVYARRNTHLRRWIIVLLIGVVGIVASAGAGQLYLQNSIHTYAAQVQEGKDNLKKENIDGTQKQVQDLTDTLKLVTQVLQRQILFSKLIVQIGSTLPNGSILSGLSINNVQGGLDLQASAVDYQTATQVQLNLQDKKNNIFDKADIISIQCSSQSSPGSVQNKYPCTVQVRALFAKNNSFSLISPTTGSTKQ